MTPDLDRLRAAPPVRISPCPSDPPDLPECLACASESRWGITFSSGRVDDADCPTCHGTGTAPGVLVVRPAERCPNAVHTYRSDGAVACPYRCAYRYIPIPTGRTELHVGCTRIDSGEFSRRRRNPRICVSCGAGIERGGCPNIVPVWVTESRVVCRVGDVTAEEWRETTMPAAEIQGVLDGKHPDFGDMVSVIRCFLMEGE